MHNDIWDDLIKYNHFYIIRRHYPRVERCTTSLTADHRSLCRSIALRKPSFGSGCPILGDQSQLESPSLMVKPNGLHVEHCCELQKKQHGRMAQQWSSHDGSDGSLWCSEVQAEFHEDPGDHYIYNHIISYIFIYNHIYIYIYILYFIILYNII